MVSQKQGQYKLCTGEKCLQNSCHFLKALLELAYTDLNAQMHDAEQEKVQVKWIDDDILEITGTSIDRKNNPKEGTKVEALLEVVKKSLSKSSSRFDLSFTKHNIRNSIDLLKSIPCNENQRLSSTNPIQKYTLEEEDLSTKSQGIRKFTLRLKGKEEGSNGNLKYLKEKIEKKYGNFEYPIDNIEENNKGFYRKNQKIEELLGDLNCQTQKRTFQDRTRDHDNRGGVFLIKAEKAIQPWFLWCLTKLIGDCDNAQVITTQIDSTVQAEFDNFWQKFAKNIGIEGNVDSTVIIDKLTEYHRKKSVVIVVKRFEELADVHFARLFDFCSELFKSISNISMTDFEKRKLWFVVFLVSKQKSFFNKNNQNMNMEYPIEIELTKISKNEVEDWLNKHQKYLKEINSGKEESSYDNGLKVLEKFSEEPDYLIDDICQNLLGLEKGYVDVEHYWKKFA